MLIRQITIFLIAPGLIGVIERFTNIDLKPSWWKHLFGIYPFVLYNDRQGLQYFGNLI